MKTTSDQMDRMSSDIGDIFEKEKAKGVTDSAIKTGAKQLLHETSVATTFELTYGDGRTIRIVIKEITPNQKPKQTK